MNSLKIERGGIAVGGIVEKFSKNLRSGTGNTPKRSTAAASKIIGTIIFFPASQFPTVSSL